MLMFPSELEVIYQNCVSSWLVYTVTNLQQNGVIKEAVTYAEPNKYKIFQIWFDYKIKVMNWMALCIYPEKLSYE